MAKFETYPSDKKIGIEWLSELPKHWQIKRSKRIFMDDLFNGHTETDSITG